MEAFHFKERIRLFAESANDVLKEQRRLEFGKTVGKIVQRFNRDNQRLLRYRNFTVHGPRNRIDEFSLLREWELSGMFLHSDLWEEFNKCFESTRLEWKTVTQNLISSIEKAAADIQLLNEHCLNRSDFSFVGVSSDTVAA